MRRGGRSRRQRITRKGGKRRNMRGRRERGGRGGRRRRKMLTEEGDFEVTIRRVEISYFSLNVTQAISEMNRNKDSDQQTEEHLVLWRKKS